MMRRTRQLSFYDVLFQFRHGFYLVYLLVSVLYIIILFNIPESHRLMVTNALVFSDTSILGLMFVGAILLLEKQQDILHSLFVTPLLLREYLAAKVLSLTLISVTASLLIFVISNGLGLMSGLFLPGVILGSSIFILIGLGIGARVNSLNGYIFGIMVGTIIFTAPLLSYLNVYDGLWLYILPTRATLLLLASTHQPLSSGHVIYAFFNLIAWIILAWPFAVKSFRTFIIEE